MCYVYEFLGRFKKSKVYLTNEDFFMLYETGNASSHPAFTFKANKMFINSPGRMLMNEVEIEEIDSLVSFYGTSKYDRTEDVLIFAI